MVVTHNVFILRRVLGLMVQRNLLYLCWPLLPNPLRGMRYDETAKTKRNTAFGRLRRRV